MTSICVTLLLNVYEKTTSNKQVKYILGGVQSIFFGVHK